MTLGIDFGTSHLGLALADGPLAEPLTTIPFLDAISQLTKLVNSHHIDTIVVGIASNPVDPGVQKFLTSLKPLNCRIVTWDETLTTIDAKNSLLHTSQAHRRRKEHSAAAALILQSYLDSR